MKFPVGSKVRIATTSCYFTKDEEGTANPDLVGTVLENDRDGWAEHDYEVRWSNGKTNTYRHTDLVNADELKRRIPEKHMEYYIAYAEGKDIEFKSCTGDWWEASTPSWDEATEYRIKPKGAKEVFPKLLTELTKVYNEEYIVGELQKVIDGGDNSIVDAPRLGSAFVWTSTPQGRDFLEICSR